MATDVELILTRV